MNIVVVGGGLAAATAVEELRSLDYTGDITVLAEEPHPPYERPPLSKDLLLGKVDPESVLVHDRDWYDEHGVDLRTATPATRLDLDRSHVVAGDLELPYDRLLLATGARPRQLPAFAAAGVETTVLRTLDDALALRLRLSDGAGHLLVVGAGWIGLEVASAARQAGAEVTVVETAPLPLLRVLGHELATVFADLHREHGVDLRLGTSLGAVAVEDGRAGVTLSDGHVVRPDLVLVAVGVEPEVGLAAAAGLTTDGGIHVDGWLRAADPHVYAAGDVANHDHPVLGHRVRVEHWDTAIHQGRHAARTMLGADEPYTRMPYFFTDQYDLGMEYVGHVGPDGYDEVVVRGDHESRVLTAFWIREGVVVAGMHVNDWDAIDAVRGWVGRRADASLRDPAVPLVDAG